MEAWGSLWIPKVGDILYGTVPWDVGHPSVPVAAIYFAWHLGGALLAVMLLHAVGALASRAVTLLDPPRWYVAEEEAATELELLGEASDERLE